MTTQEASLTRLQRYLDSLPSGLESYPDATAKAGLLRAHQSYARTPADRLPESLAHLLSNLPPVNIWVQDTYWVALGLAHADAFFPGDDDGYIADERRRAEALMETSTYKMLRLMTSPSMYVRSAPQRWQTLHRGSELRELSSESSGAVLELTSPPGLFPPLFLRQVAMTFEHMTGYLASSARVELQTVRNDCSRFHFVWN